MAIPVEQLQHQGMGATVLTRGKNSHGWGCIQGRTTVDEALLTGKSAARWLRKWDI
jgi:hypothetical protein